MLLCCLSSGFRFDNSNYNYSNTNTNVSSHLSKFCSIDLANMAKQDYNLNSVGSASEGDILKSKGKMEMYNEIQLINKITDKQSKARLISLFIEEYAGWLNHLNSVGLKWGAGGEEMGANREAIKSRQHIDLLNVELLKLIV